MAIVIGLHGNVCCPNKTGQVTSMSNLSCCLVKTFVHMTHCIEGCIVSFIPSYTIQKGLSEGVLSAVSSYLYLNVYMSMTFSNF